MKTQKGMNLLLIIFGIICCVYSFSLCFISYYSLSLHYIFHPGGFYEIAFHSFKMHKFSQNSFAEMAASTGVLPRIPILPIEDIEAMGEANSSQERLRLPQESRLASVSIRHQHTMSSKKRSTKAF